jgi:serine-type D-Ala-D-Ala carboxypeptidase/endopeptidase (penicillin-binding protein 4)
VSTAAASGHKRGAGPVFAAWFWLGLLVSAAVAQPAPRVELLARQIDEILEEPAMARAFFGAKVVSLRTGEVVYEKNANQFFVPASNMKLVTALGAIETLGLDYRFRTTIATDAEIRDGTLEGDLLILGGADPTLGARIASWDVERLDRGDPLAVLKGWAEELKRQGIRRIKGDVVGDSSIFGEPSLGNGWSWDDLAWGYAAPVTGLPFNENLAVVHLEEDEAGVPPRVRVEPPIAPLRVINLLRPTNHPEQGPIRAVRASQGITVLRGRKQQSQPRLLTLSIDHPAYFAQMFKETLEAAGIKIEGEARIRSERLPGTQEMKELVVYESPDLRWIIRVLLKVSQNLYAETLLRMLSPAVAGKTSEEGIGYLEGLLERSGVPLDGVVIADGSGLSRYNLLTPQTVVDILQYIYGRPYRDDFMGSLPVGALDGTLRYRMIGSSGAATRAKTGSLANVRALSGYIRRSDGELLAFSLILNHFKPNHGSKPETFLDRIAAYLAE